MISSLFVSVLVILISSHVTLQGVESVRLRQSVQNKNNPSVVLAHTILPVRIRSRRRSFREREMGGERCVFVIYLVICISSSIVFFFFKLSGRVLLNALLDSLNHEMMGSRGYVELWDLSGYAYIVIQFFFSWKRLFEHISQVILNREVCQSKRRKTHTHTHTDPRDSRSVRCKGFSLSKKIG